MGAQFNMLNSRRGPVALLACTGLLAAQFVVPAAQAQVNVTTWHNDGARTGANTHEQVLTTANVNVNQFGRLFQITLDGQVYAQPLVMAGVQIAGGTHNVVYVATEHDSVYAIDGDNGTIYRQVSLIPSGGTTVNASSDLVQQCLDLSPEIGITGTPVIDPASQTLYVVSKAKVGGRLVQHLHALDIATMAEKFGGPTEIQATAPGTAPDGDGGVVTFNPSAEHQRPGLALDNGHVLITWASHCDHDVYHGWMISYNAQTLAQDGVWNVTPNGAPGGNLIEGGIWMSGAAPAVDGAGNIYLATGNGYQNGTTDFGDSVVKLGPPVNGRFPVLDYFTPFNEGGSNTLGDTDLGSGGVLLLPTTTNGSQFLTQAGKAQTIHILDQNNLGKLCSNCASDTQIPQEVTGAGFVLSTPVYLNGHIYWNTGGHPVTSWSFDTNTGVMSTAPVSQSTAAVGNFSATDAASISSNNASNGIYWLMHNTGELFAFDATDLTNVLWRSGQASGNRDQGGSATKFAPPTIANGHVYVGNSTNPGALVGYGLFGGKATIPTFSPPGGTYATAQTVTISDTTPNPTFFYTTNGTTPTTASTQYTGPVSVAASETLQAIAVANGIDNSDVGSATYTIGSGGGGNPPVQTAQPTFSPPGGTFTAAQSVTISDSTPGAVIYFTTDSSTPTTSSTIYTAPINVATTEILNAVAIAPGDTASNVTSATYTINAGGGGTSPVINDPNGFSSTTGLTLDSNGNGAIALQGTALLVTSGANYEAHAIWSSTPVNVQSFTNDFSFQISPASPNASDGFTFTIQNTGLNALGGIGGALGYQGIGKSVAVKFDTFNNDGEGANSIGFYTNGNAPTLPATDLTGRIDLHSGHVMQAHLTYDGTTLALTLTDTQTGVSVRISQAIDIPGTVGGTTAWVGFTGGTGGTVSTQSILNWVYTPGNSTSGSGGGSSGGSGSGSGGGTAVVNFDSGFTATPQLSLLQGAAVAGDALVVTNGGNFENGAAWFPTQVNVGRFTTDFDFQITPAGPQASDGFTFTLQNTGLNATGGIGGALGYGGIKNSVAVKFDTFNNAGEGVNSTGFFTGGVDPTVPASDLTAAGIDLHNGAVLHAHVTYDGTILTLVLSDPQTNAQFTLSQAVGIPGAVGSTAAYVGFTGGTGGTVSTQKILTWTYLAQ
jgi:Legume lectin domain/Chitobiase/beta-hexosaminidase C-terminal domain